MQTVYILIGNIGSGKTFWARRKVLKGAIYISNDAITNMFHMDGYIKYDNELKDLYHEVEKAIFLKALDYERDIIVDRTNISKAKRKRFLDLVQYGRRYWNLMGKELKVVAVVFDIDFKTAMERREKSNKGLDLVTWAGVYERFAREYQAPELSEGFDDIILGPRIGEYKIHAFDFDGCICENKYPEIGKPIEATIDKMMELWGDDSTRITIWSCRHGTDELNMVRWLRINNISFDYVNYDAFWTGGTKCRKLFAHYYYDDRNCYHDILTDPEINSKVKKVE